MEPEERICKRPDTKSREDGRRGAEAGDEDAEEMSET
jgi:hypothetical protein